MPDYKVIPYRGKLAIEWYENGKRIRRSLGTTDRSQIGSEVRRVMAEIEVERRPKVITVAYAWDGYVKSLGDKPASVTAGFQWRSVGPHFGGMPANEVTEEDCKAYTLKRREQGRSDGTIATELGRLRSALLWAERRGLIDKAPFISRPQQAPPRDKWLTREQARRFLEECRLPHVKLFATLAITTGARMSAILELTWDQIDMDARRIDLAGRGRVFTKKGRAVLPMNEMAFQALLEARERASGQWVIEWGGQKVDNIKKGILGAGKRAGLPWVTAHVFRHSAAVWMAQDRVPMAEIAQFLGHRDSRVTERVYARYSPDYLHRAAKSLDLFGESYSTDLRFNSTYMDYKEGTKVLHIEDGRKRSLK